MNDSLPIPVPGDAARVQHVFNVPASMVGVCGCSTLVFHELTAEDEIMASKRARGDAGTLAYELAKASLAAVDGKRLSLSDGSVDRWFSHASPKVRGLIVTAYNEIHSVTQGDADAFLKSRKVVA